MRIRTSILLLLASISCYCQSNQRIEDSIHIYWQPKIEINKDDFRFDGRKEPNAELYCQKVKLCACAATNINIVIDTPKDSTSNAFEKIYIAPVLEKTKSYIFGNDEDGILQQKVVFDIEEWSARYARQQLEETLSQFGKRRGSIITWHKVVLQNARTERTKMIDQFTLDVYLQPKKNAYKNWRSKVDKLLKNLKKYATTENECQRIMNGVPLDESLKQSIFLGDHHH